MTPLTTQQLAETARTYCFPNYGDRDLAIVSGKGCRVRDAEGNEYLDFLGGIAVNSLGHCHPAVVEAIRAQAAELIHCSNLYLIDPYVRLAERLCRETGMKKAFFCNSGTEATEAAMKLARRWAANTRGDGHATIIAFEGSFHGRTYGSMSATWNKKVREGFGTALSGVRFANFNDLESVDAAWGEDVCAVLVETVQGEGGVNPASHAFLTGLRERCSRADALLMIDEIQCGMGRCGYPFAYQGGHVQPDVVLAAKALGGGLPLGGVLAGEKACDVFQPGTHGSTFGGNPVACAAALAVCDIVFDPDFLEAVGEKGCHFWGGLGGLQREFPELIKTIRGLGLMIGMELTRPGAEIVKIARRHGLLINCTADKVLRFLPPLTVEQSDIDEAVEKLHAALKEFEAQANV
ncbi:MAG: acetylornithine/N-succinyldiaminopimelate aminotransferase [Candidatus Sumerlaeota bacterium]|nr:acetylornithine/N-succinyldiaminopimelate aminotransferase [Candidatus Sumerlaeota bacterium]